MLKQCRVDFNCLPDEQTIQNEIWRFHELINPERVGRGEQIARSPVCKRGNGKGAEQFKPGARHDLRTALVSRTTEAWRPVASAAWPPNKYCTIFCALIC